MKRALTTALYYKISTDGPFLLEALGGTLYDGEAPAGAKLPYAVYSVISYTDISTFTEDIFSVVLQFSIFSEKSSSAEIKDLEAQLNEKGLFHAQAFTFDGGRVIDMGFEQSVGPRWQAEDMETGEPGYWQTDCDYQVIIQRDS